MSKFFSLLFAIVLMTTLANAQDVPNSFGPAPERDIKQTIDPQSMQVGTRYFLQYTGFQFAKGFLEACTFTNVGPVFAITFPGGLMYRNGTVYTWNQASPYQMWSIDTVTGVHTLQFNLTGVTLTNLTGMVFDGTTVYALQSNLAQSQILTVNMTTGAMTPVGSPSATCAGGITMLGRQGAQYSLFVHDLVADNIYKCNKTTGVFTLVGPAGFDANFGQDGGVDWRDNAFYLACYNQTAGGPQLRKLDTAVGSSTLLCTFAVTQATGLAPLNLPSAPGNPLTICRNNLVKPILDHQFVYDTITIATNPNFIVSPLPVGGAPLSVRIDTLTHTWDADVRMYLRKGAIGTRFINSVGSSGDNFIGTVIKDSAGLCAIGGASCNTPPFTGTFAPSTGGSFAAFTGQAVNGSWIIAVSDTATADTGNLRAWCLVIRYLDITSGQTGEITIPNNYILSQNYPNPFNPSTTIQFALPKNDMVKLVIYDIMGREVKTLVNEHRNAGTYEVSFDASTLASGVYFYKLETPNFTQTKKMLLVK